MSNQTEINRMILNKIRKSSDDSSIREFLEQILNFEIANSDKELIRYKEKYLELVQRYYTNEMTERSD